MSTPITQLPQSTISAIMQQQHMWTPLAGGGCSEVFLAPLSRSSKCVVKRLKTPFDSAAVAALNNELRILSKIPSGGSSCIVQLLGSVDPTDQNPSRYLILEHVPGMSLQELSETRFTLAYTFPAKTLQSILTGVLEALLFLYTYGIVHRDIKPHNIMTTYDGTEPHSNRTVKLIDFGLAYHPSSPDQETIKRGCTPAFAPPEFFDTETGSTTPPSDVWSTVATAFYLITGRPVYQECATSMQQDLGPPNAKEDPYSVIAHSEIALSDVCIVPAFRRQSPCDNPPIPTIHERIKKIFLCVRRANLNMNTLWEQSPRGTQNQRDLVKLSQLLTNALSIHRDDRPEVSTLLTKLSELKL